MYSSQDHGTVYVDYAHNYASTRALLGFLKRQNPNGRVVAVVGSPGNKGIDRREGFGKALNEEADVAYLTTDDPAYENPQKLLKKLIHILIMIKLMFILILIENKQLRMQFCLEKRKILL